MLPLRGDVPVFSATIRKLTRQLYPTGRAWWMVVGGIFDKIHEALSYSESEAYQYNIDLLNAILPDNDYFTVEDAENHESALGLISNNNLSLKVRKQAILRKIQYPGNIPARQDWRYVQAQLQTAGFDVYVHENRSQILPAIYDLFRYDQITYDSIGILPTYSIVANYMKENRDASFNIGTQDTQNFLFFIGGSILGNIANVDENRKNEFRELILKLKPANMVSLLLINYI